VTRPVNRARVRSLVRDGGWGEVHSPLLLAERMELMLRVVRVELDLEKDVGESNIVR
jgi:hypothetical protein